MAGRETVKVVTDHGPMGWVLFMAWMGAVIYFFEHDPNLWGFIVAIFKGAVWPAYVLYYGLGLLHV